MEANDSWPLFGLTIRTPRLTLRYATDADLQELAQFRADEVLLAGEEPFDGDSSFYSSAPQACWKAYAGELGARAKTSPEWWYLAFAVEVGGRLVGQQSVTAVDFLKLRTVNSFSFIGLAHRRQGIGREMRSALLHLVFAELGAERAESDAFEDNAGSVGVSRSLGYAPNGSMLAPRPSGGALMLRFVMTKTDWKAQRRDDITVEGLEHALPMLGLAAGPTVTVKPDIATP